MQDHNLIDLFQLQLDEEQCANLSPRSMTVIKAALHGKKNAETAAELGISLRHVSRLKCGTSPLIKKMLKARKGGQATDTLIAKSLKLLPPSQSKVLAGRLLHCKTYADLGAEYAMTRECARSTARSAVHKINAMGITL